jgi:hypothetical protein
MSSALTPESDRCTDMHMGPPTRSLSVSCLVVEVCCEGHRRSRPGACAAETLPMPLAIMLGGARPVASDPVLPRWWRTGCVYLRRYPSRRQPPSRSRPGFALAASHGRHIGARRRRYPTSASVLIQSPQPVRAVRGMIVASRARIAAQCSSLNSISGSAASSFRNVCARYCTRHFSTSAILRSSAGAGRQW